MDALMALALVHRFSAISTSKVEEKERATIVFKRHPLITLHSHFMKLHVRLQFRYIFINSKDVTFLVIRETTLHR